MLRRLRNTSRVAGGLLGLCALLRLGSACVDGPTAASAGDGFLLTPDNVVLTAVADTVRLSAGHDPTDAAAGAIAWSTSDSTVAVVDSTGLKVFGEGEWKMRKHGKSKRRTWRKLSCWGILPFA